MTTTIISEPMVEKHFKLFKKYAPHCKTVGDFLREADSGKIRMGNSIVKIVCNKKSHAIF